MIEFNTGRKIINKDDTIMIDKIERSPFKIIEKMNKKISFLKNPRFRVNKSPIIMTDAMKNKSALEA